MKKQVLISKEKFKQMLEDADVDKRMHIVGRALVVIFNNQTSSEQIGNVTDVDNGIGFTGFDGKGGSLTAKSYLYKKSLLPWQVAAWTRKDKNGWPRICKYHSQINDAAVKKAERKAAKEAELKQFEVQENGKIYDYGNDMERLVFLKEMLGESLDSDDPKILDPIDAEIKLIERRWEHLKG